MSEHDDNLVQQALKIWQDGGWAMIAIAVIAFLMFGLGLEILAELRRKGHRRLDEDLLRDWIKDPSRAEGPIGILIREVGEARSLDQVSDRFDAVRAESVEPLERDLGVMKVFVHSAPLVGLLGTVTGMLATFAALSSGSGGEKTMTMVSKGISEALVTTMTGLVIALPGLFLQYRLSRGLQGYRSFLAHLESLCTQSLYRELQVRSRARVLARDRILGTLVRGLRTRQMQDQVLSA